MLQPDFYGGEKELWDAEARCFHIVDFEQFLDALSQPGRFIESEFEILATVSDSTMLAY